MMSTVLTTPMEAAAFAEPPATTLGKVRQAFGDGMVLAKRNLSHIRRVPEKLIDVTLQPVLFVFLFGYVFGSAIVVPGGGNYREYLMPGIFVFTMASTLPTTAVGFAQDLSKGVIDRFRSLPMARSGVLLGRSISDVAEALLGLTVLATCGLLAGWRVNDGAASALAGFGLMLLLACAFNWIGMYVGQIVRDPEAAQAVMFATIFPLMFVSNSFVPTAGMPTWLRTFAEWNPISATIQACRDLFGNTGDAVPASAAWPLHHPVVASLFWSVLLLAIFVPLAVRRYRTATQR